MLRIARPASVMRQTTQSGLRGLLNQRSAQPAARQALTISRSIRCPSSSNSGSLPPGWLRPRRSQCKCRSSGTAQISREAVMGRSGQRGGGYRSLVPHSTSACFFPPTSCTRVGRLNGAIFLYMIAALLSYLGLVLTGYSNEPREDAHMSHAPGATCPRQRGCATVPGCRNWSKRSRYVSRFHTPVPGILLRRPCLHACTVGAVSHSRAGVGAGLGDRL